MSYDVADMMKAQQWERCKGELRALVAMQGSYSSTDDSDRTKRWEELGLRVEQFIEGVEVDALHE